MTDEPREEQLYGGITNAGGVVRVGDHVLRSSNPFSGSVHRFLTALDAAGFEGASTPVGIDPDGRERLTYIAGEAPGPPYPAWARGDAALGSAAALLGRMHAAAPHFDPTGSAFSAELADPDGGPIVCHNDLCLDNIIFRDGEAVGFIDFDFAAPGRPLYDLAHLVRHLVPIIDDTMGAFLGWTPANRPARLRLAADRYGLDAAARAELLELIPVALARSRDLHRGRVEAGDPNFAMIWDFTGGERRFDEQDRWWLDHQPAFAAALA
jgi:Ser/Thr protein kinase RdoA (MazF antagonist)